MKIEPGSEMDKAIAEAWPQRWEEANATPKANQGGLVTRRGVIVSGTNGQNTATSKGLKMTYAEALVALGQDKRVRRPHWKGGVCLKPMWLGPTAMRFDPYFFWARRLQQRFIPDPDERDATDWEIYEPRR
jgi:hypothetical protein